MAPRKNPVEKTTRLLRSSKIKDNKTIAMNKIETKNQRTKKVPKSSSSIDELLKLCKPLTVRLTNCDELIKQHSK